MALSFRYLIFRLSRLILWAGVVCAPLGVFGTVPPVGPGASEKEVSLRFTVFALGGADGLSYRSARDEPPRALRFYSAYRSARYDYRGGERLSFYEAGAATADLASGPDAAPVATYVIPEGADEMLLLFLPRAEPTPDGLRYDVYGVEDGVGRTPPGHFRIINVSGREYVAHFSGGRITIPQGVGDAHAARGRVSLVLATQVGEAWLATGKHEFSLTPRDRVTLIFYPSASGTSVYPVIRRLVDTVPGERLKRAAVAELP